MENNKKSIMIITFAMIPYSLWGACQRMFYQADYLQKHGYNVYIVHAKKSEYFGNFGHKIQFQSIPIALSTINQSRADKKPDGKSIGIVFQQLFLGSLKFIVDKTNILALEKIIFNEPNVGLGVYGYLFTKKARNTIFEMLSKKRIGQLIISAPPFSVYAIVPQIKRQFPEVQIILDYRDPWNTPYLSYFFPSLMEKHILKSADMIVFLNDRMLKDISLKYNLSKEKCRVIQNGYSKQDWDEVLSEDTAQHIDENRSNRMILSYIGDFTLNKGGFRDLSSFMDAFKLFKNNKNILVRFIGVNPSDKVEEIKRQFTENIEILPPVDTKKALSYMLKSDVLFLNHSDEKTGKYVLTGKIFDYMRSGRVIWGIAGSEDTYFLELIKQYNLGISCSSNPSQILECLDLLYKKWLNGSLKELRKDTNLNVEIFSREINNCKYLQILEELEFRNNPSFLAN
jgi:glycosyltransferase involved in cell wall biosynthesis